MFLSLFRTKTTGTNRPLAVSSKAVDFVADYEKFVAQAYKPTPYDVWTVGYGTTKGVKPGDTMTEPEARKRLEFEIQEFAEDVASLLKTNDAPDLKQHQFDAVVSLVYNVGLTAFKRSLAFRYLCEGNFVRFLYEAYDRAQGFTKQNGKILEGLAKRRHDEAEMFINGTYERTY